MLSMTPPLRDVEYMSVRNQTFGPSVPRASRKAIRDGRTILTVPRCHSVSHAVVAATPIDIRATMKLAVATSRVVMVVVELRSLFFYSKIGASFASTSSMTVAGKVSTLRALRAPRSSTRG